MREFFVLTRRYQRPWPYWLGPLAETCLRKTRGCMQDITGCQRRPCLMGSRHEISPRCRSSCRQCAHAPSLR